MGLNLTYIIVLFFFLSKVTLITKLNLRSRGSYGLENSEIFFMKLKINLL